MTEFINRLGKHTRLLTQLGFTALSNGNWKGFVQGGIYRGAFKKFCVPGLNCYSCPGALGSCPIGSLQAVAGAPRFRFSYYIAGLLVIFGALLGRFVCGWLCPFGLVQDLLYKIPFFKKIKKLPGDRFLQYLRYAALILLVLLLPALLRNDYGVGTPWFCKLICPSGTLLGGVPQLFLNPSLRQTAGALFLWKLAVLLTVILLSLLLWRPFCRYLCPLGAIYGLFNPVAALRHRLDETRCTKCTRCKAACRMDLTPYLTPNSTQCIRCGDCIRACPQEALSTTLWKRAVKVQEQAK